MNTDTIVYGIAVAVLLAGVGVSAMILTSNTAPNTQERTYVTTQSGSLDLGDVLIELNPQGIENGLFIVRYSANTHSVALAGYDLAKHSTLYVNDQEIPAVQATPMQGHHNQGILAFEMASEPTDFVIRITNIPAVDTRIHEYTEMTS